MDRITIVLLIAIAITVLIFFLWYLFKTPKVAPISRPKSTSQSRLRAEGPIVQNSVVGAIIPSGTDISRLVGATRQGQDNVDVEFPVGTLLVNDAPPSIQLELLMKTPLGSVQGIDVPDTFDCREKWPGLISGAYHQGTCGSCWAFASAMAVSDRFRIADPEDKELMTKFWYFPFAPGSCNCGQPCGEIQPNRSCYPVLNNLSPYYLVDCDICGKTFASFPQATNYVTGGDQECNDGCQGGYLQLVYNFMMTAGTPTLLSAPTNCDPTIQSCPCRTVQDAKLYKPKRVYSLVAPNESKEVRRRRIMEDVFVKGPVSIGFAVFQSFYDYFANNPTGVYSNLVRPANDREIGGHAVDIVGWGTDSNGTFYWTMRNSWGDKWGEQGFFKIQYDFKGILENVMAGEV